MDTTGRADLTVLAARCILNCDLEFDVARPVRVTPARRYRRCRVRVPDHRSAPAGRPASRPAARLLCRRARGRRHGHADARRGAASAPEVERRSATSPATSGRCTTPSPTGCSGSTAARPLPSVEGAVLAVSDARAYGLDPDDYDAAALQVQWAAIKGGRATTVERAQFDLALSVAGARLVRAVYIGRVDPALLRWKYDGPRKAIDPAALLQDARAGRGLGDVLRSLEPKVLALRPCPRHAGHVPRARRGGRTAAGAGVAGGTEEGRAGAGVERRAATRRAAAGRGRSRRGRPRDPHPLHRRHRRRGQAVPDTARPRGRRRDRREHASRDQRAARRARPADRTRDGAHALAARCWTTRRTSSSTSRTSGCGPTTRARRRSRCA